MADPEFGQNAIGNQVLYDKAGNAVGVVLDGSIYRLQLETKIARASDGTYVNPATQETLSAVNDKTPALVSGRVPTDGSGVTQPISAAALPLPMGAATETGNLATLVGKDFATQTTLLTRATEATLLAADGRLTTIDSVLDSIKDTDGIKKIVDALPIGDNIIGRAKVTDGTNVLGVDVQNHVYVSGKAAIGAAPSTNPVSISGTDASGYKRSLRTDTDGRIQVVAAIIPGLAASMINLSYLRSIGALVTNNYRRAISYTIPTGYSGYLIRFTTWQNEAAYSRIAIEKDLATLDVSTNVFIAEESYTDPQWAAIVEAEVTTQMGAANNVTVTMSYTNEFGVSGRTGTFSVSKNSIVGTRVRPTLEGDDLGMRSVQNLSASPSGGAGVLLLRSFIQLSLHYDFSATAGVDTNYAPSAISFGAGTMLVIEFSGGTVAKERSLGALIQLVQ